MGQEVSALVAEALDAVHRAPVDAVRLADSLLSGPLDDESRALALWARGQGYRETNRLDAAEQDLREAIELVPHRSSLAGEIWTSLAAVLMYRGDPEGAQKAVDVAREAFDGNESGRLRMQQGFLAHRRGDLSEAAERYRQAVPLLESAGDSVAAARTHSNIGVLMMQTGEDAAAVHHLDRSIELARAHGQRLAATVATHNLACVRASMGETPIALQLFDEAEREYVDLDEVTRRATLLSDRATALSEARLIPEALSAADAAMALAGDDVNVIDLGDLALTAARARSEAGEHRRAGEAADLAHRVFDEQARSAWSVLARWVRLHIADGSEHEIEDGDLATRLIEVSDDLAAAGWTRESVFARSLAVRRLVRAGRLADAETTWANLSATAGDGLLEVVAAASAEAVLADATEDGDRVFSAVDRGLAAVERSLEIVDAMDLRMFAARRADDLLVVGTRRAVESGDARRLIDLVERSRRLLYRVTGGRSAEIDRDLLMRWRRANRRVREADDATARSSAAADLVAAEGAITRRSHRAVPVVPSSTHVDDEIAQTSEGRLCFVELDGRIHGVVSAGGDSRIAACGPTARITADVDALSFALSRLQRSSASRASNDAALESMHAALGDLGRSLAPALDGLGDATQVAVVPSGSLRDVCWGALPELRDRSIRVSMSLRPARADRDLGTDHGRTHECVAVAGPDLRFASTEARSVARRWPGSSFLDVDRATVDAVRQTFASADVVHLACHGTFRHDNPLFSSVRLADGSLTPYELAGTDSLPHVVVLSACHAASTGRLHGDAILGMATAFLQLGVATVIAPVTPVNDERSVDLMVRLHSRLAAGVEPATALAAASTLPDGSLDPTAAPFVCFGG